MKQPDIRWKQRFQNFKRAFSSLKEAIEQENLNELERNGLIQRFEFTIDLAWKVMKDFLEEVGFDFKPSPKDTFRLAQQAQYINYAQELIDTLTLRNELSHDYDSSAFVEGEIVLRKEIFPVLEKLYRFFAEENEK